MGTRGAPTSTSCAEGHYLTWETSTPIPLQWSQSQALQWSRVPPSSSQRQEETCWMALDTDGPHRATGVCSSCQERKWDKWPPLNTHGWPAVPIFPEPTDTCSKRRATHTQCSPSLDEPISNSEPD